MYSTTRTRVASQDVLLDELRSAVDASDDSLLARANAPLIHLDTNEPFLPLVVGYTVFREASKSPSSKFQIDPEGGVAIEYAIWWDWDIQHLYELEHIWVYLDTNANLAKVDASAHGEKCSMRLDDGSLPRENDRVTLYAEPGKHGFLPEPSAFITHLAEFIKRNCGADAGKEGILIHSRFGAAAFGNPTAFEGRLAKRYLQRLAFAPSFEFARFFDLRTVPFLKWEQLQTWIPRRIMWWRQQLALLVPHLKLVCLDSGDTLVDEGTEVKTGEVVLHAGLIPGAAEMMRQLQADGYVLALVADGPTATFENIFDMQYGLWDVFSAFAISGAVGVNKPDARMFETVLVALDIPPSNYGGAVMVGNNLERDIKGANAIGMISIWMNWSRRRSHTPADDNEIPDYSISTPLDLPGLLEKIELGLSEND
jgi:putative hydrolase of the HAD superfamily